MNVRTWIIIFLLAAVALGAGSVGAESACNGGDLFKAWAASQGLENDTRILAFDHRRELWEGYRWDGSTSQLVKLDKKDGFRWLPSRVGSLRSSSDGLVVVAYDTSPLLFRLIPEKVSEASIDDLATLQTITSTLGSTLARVAELGDRRTEPTKAGLMDPPSDAEQEDGPSDLVDLVKRLEENLSTAALKQGVVETREAFVRLNAQVGRLQAEQASAQTFVAKVARGFRLHETYQVSRSNKPQAEADALLSDLAILEGAAETLSAAAEPCPAQLALLDTAAEARLEGDLRAEKTALGKVPEQTLRKECGLDVGPAAHHIVEWLKAHPGDRHDRALDRLRRTTRLYRRAEALFDELEKLPKTAKEMLGTISFIDALLDQQNSVLGTGPALRHPLCFLSHGVLEFERPGEPRELDLRWSKIRSAGFKIVKESALTSGVTLDRRDNLVANYQLQSTPKWLEFDFDFGLIHTDLAEETYKAVEPTTADAASNDSMDPAMMAVDKVITVTDEDSRSGDVALFATWVPFFPEKSFRIGPQIGVGIDTDDPQLFAGVGLGWQWLKISAGWTWQEIKVLDGQQVDDIVPSDDAILTKDSFEDGTYASFSVTINELPFFQPDD